MSGGGAAAADGSPIKLCVGALGLHLRPVWAQANPAHSGASIQRRLGLTPVSGKHSQVC